MLKRALFNLLLAVYACWCAPIHSMEQPTSRGSKRKDRTRLTTQTANRKIGYREFFEAAEQGNSDLLVMELERAIIIRDLHNRTTLHCAATHGHEETVQILLAAGADKEAITEDGETPLHEAAFNGKDAIIQMLLAAGADAEARTTNGLTALHLAALRGHENAVRVLINAGFDINTFSFQRETPLHLAAVNGYDAVVRILLDSGADWTAQAPGRTPLQYATLYDYESVATLLLEAELTSKVL